MVEPIETRDDVQSPSGSSNIFAAIGELLTPEDRIDDPLPVQGAFDDDLNSVPLYRYLASLGEDRLTSILYWDNTTTVVKDFIRRSLQSRGLTLWKRGSANLFRSGIHSAVDGGMRGIASPRGWQQGQKYVVRPASP